MVCFHVQRVRMVLLLLFLALFFLACNLKNPLPMTIEDIACHKVRVAPGPEDFVLDTWHKAPRLLVSSHDRRNPETSGDIFWLDIDTEASGKMPRTGDPEAIAAFKPHGMDIRHSGSRTLLYVILHDPYAHSKRSENAIAIYEVGQNTLQFERLLEDADHLWSPNDLSVLPSGDIYVTNDVHGNLDLYLRASASEIAYYDNAAGTWKMVADDIAFANGILAKPDKVYVTAMFDEKLLAFPREKDGSLGIPETVVSFKGGDNLMPYKNYLLTTAHYDDLAFLGHMKDSGKPAPSIVFMVRPEINTKHTVYVDTGEMISAASTAMIFKDKLYISQVFEPYIVVGEVPVFMR